MHVNTIMSSILVRVHTPQKLEMSKFRKLMQSELNLVCLNPGLD